MHWSGPSIIAVAALIMLAWTWGTWPDVLVDFGRELYIPWELAQGKVLYRDIASFLGPLPPYVNTLWFVLFGASLDTLVFANLVLVGLLTWLLYHAFAQVSSHWPAVAACLAFVLLFAFGQYIPVGNFNYLCPYAHEMTHGMLLSLAALVGAWHYRDHGLPLLTVSGAALGLAFLTKAEIFLPGALATVAALALTVWDTRPGRGRLAAMVGSFAVGAVVPPMLTFACFCLAMPAGQALVGTLGSWWTMANVDLKHDQFARNWMGINNLSRSLWLLFAWARGYIAALAPAVVLALTLRRPGRRRPLVAAAVFVLTVAVAWSYRADIPWRDAARPLPLFLLAAVAVFLVCLFRSDRGTPERRRLIRQVSLTVFALALLGKMLFYSRIFHYGFVLAMPATLLLVAALLDWLPAAVSRYGGYGPVFQAASLALLGVGTAAYLSIQSQFLYAKTTLVGERADTFWADARGLYVNDVLEYLAENAKPGETLAVLPEGVMINFLSRRENPTPYLFFMPFDLAIFNEGQMVAAFRAHPPDYIVLAHKDTTEYGVRFFGVHYGRQLRAWMDQNYKQVHRVGAQPLVDHQFGMVVLQKKDSTDRS
jgi:hypothetical protein